MMLCSDCNTESDDMVCGDCVDKLRSGYISRMAPADIGTVEAEMLAVADKLDALRSGTGGWDSLVLRDWAKRIKR